MAARSDASSVGAGLDRAAFDEACNRLSAAGYVLEPADQAWSAFEEARAAYAGRLEVMAAYWATPMNAWLDSNETPRSAAH